MAVVNVKEIWGGRRGGFNAEFQRRYTRRFRVETDNTADGPIEVGFATGVPRMWDRYVSHLTGEIDDFALCRSIDPAQDEDNPYLWVVECEYDSEGPEAPLLTGGGGGTGGPAKPGGGGPADKPELVPSEVSIDFETVSKPVRKSYVDPAATNPERGIRSVNSANDPLDPLPEAEIGYPVFVCSRTETTYDLARARKYAYALNSDVFLGAEPGQAQMLPITAKRVHKGLTRYWQVTYRIRFCPEGQDNWQFELLDAGYRRLDPTLGPVDIRDPISKQPVSRPWPLNGAGQPLSAADIAAGNFKSVDLYLYRELPFAVFNLEGEL